MILYTTKYCPFTLRIHLLLALKNLDYEVVDPDRIGPQEFKNRVPEGRVPALVTDEGQVLVESECICEYLEERYPEKPAYPKDLVERAELRKWARRADIDISNSLTPLFMMDRWGESPVLLEEAKAGFKDKFEAVERQFGDGPYILGQNLTHADGAWLTMLHLAKRMLEKYGLEDPIEHLPKLRAYRKALSENAVVRPLEETYVAAVAALMTTTKPEAKEIAESV